MTAVQAVSASSFTSAIGINTHIDFNWSAYNNFAQVENALSYLGVTTIRDSIDNPMDPIKFTQLNGDLGVKLDAFISPGSVGFDWQVQKMEALGSKILVSVEGANESDNWSQTYNGLSGLPATEAEQAALYKDIKSNASTSGVTVIQSSFGQLSTFATVSGIAADADMGNAHTYFGTDNNPGGSWITTVDNYASQVTPAKSVAVTETGYYTLADGGAGVNDTTQAKYDLDDLLDQFKAGSSIVDLYELVDQQPEAGNTNPEYAFGLFNYDYTPKPAAIAVHNLLSILNASSSTPGTVTPGALTYSLANMPSGANSYLFQKSDGTFVLALWNDVRLQSATGGANIDVAPVNVTLSLGQAYAYVDVFDPLSGSAPVQVATNSSSITIALPDHPVLIELSQMALSAIATGPTIEAPTKLYTEVGTSVQVDGLTVSDSTAGTMTVDITASAGSLSLTMVSGTLQTGNSLTLTGTAAAIDAELATLTYTGGAATGAAAVTVYAIDAAGLSSSQIITANTEVTPTEPALTPPVLTLPGSEAVTAGATTAVKGISVTESYAAWNPGNMTLIVNDTKGTLAMTDWAGAAVSGSGTNSIIFKGDFVEITAALASLTYTASSAAGTDTISFSVYDQPGQNTTGRIAVNVALPIPVVIVPVLTTPVVAAPAPTPVLGVSGPVLILPGAQSVTTGSVTPIAAASFADVVAASNAGKMYMNVSDSSGLLAMTDQSGALLAGSGSTSITYNATFANLNAALASLVYTAGGHAGADAIRITLYDQLGRNTTSGIAISVSAAVTAAAPMVTPTSAILTSASATVTGTSVLTTAIFANGNGAPDQKWSISEAASGAVNVTAPTAGYAGTATLTGINNLTIGANTYALIEGAPGGGSLSIASPAAGVAGTVVVDGAGADTLTFAGSGTSYWHVGAGSDTATLSSGFTNIYLADVRSNYLVLNYGGGQLVLRDYVNPGYGSQTINIASGTGQLTFADGSVIGLGNVGDTIQYGGLNTVWTIGSGSVSDAGGSGLSTAKFTTAIDTTPDANWTFQQNAPGSVTVTGNSAAGYTGTAALQGLGNIQLGSNTYQVEMASYWGQSSTYYVGWQMNAGANATIFLDGTNNDTLSFGDSHPMYWYAQGGTDTATLAAGNTAIILKGSAADYVESYDGTGTLTVTNVNNMDGTGTKILNLAGGRGELQFGDGTKIGLGSLSSDTTQYGGHAAILAGTAANDTIYVGAGGTATGNGGNDTYCFGAGDGAVTVNNGASSSNAAAGQVDFLGTLTDENLWFQKSGNSLVVDVLGTHDQMTLTNWYTAGDSYAQVSQFAAGSLKLDSQIATLVQAMATFSASHLGFNPQASATAMPNDTTLQNTIAASWHS